jgi:hypothetical protein
MSTAANLAAQYYDLLNEDADRVSALFKAVSQDAQTETLDLEESVKTVNAKATQLEANDEKAREAMISINAVIGPTHLQQARRKLIGWLNALWWYIAEAWPNATAKPSRVVLSFLWEFNTRLSKALVVAMVLEGRNLRSFGATPEQTDIPQCLAHLWHRLAVCREYHFGALRDEYVVLVQSLPTEYTALYLKQ